MLLNQDFNFLSYKYSFLKFTYLLCCITFIFAPTLITNGKKSKEQNNSFINNAKHDVLDLTDISFNTRVLQKRTSQISFVMLCSTKSLSTNCKKTVQGEWNDIAIEMNGMALFAAADCYTNSKLCEKVHPEKRNDIETPTVIVFPTLPLDPFVFEGNFSVPIFKKLVSRYYPFDEIEKISEENLNNFLATYQQLPKAIFFSDKNSPPVLLKILSHDFDKKIRVGFVSSKEQSLIKRWKVEKFPTLILIQQNGKEITYNKSDWKYPSLFDWLNVYSETFVIDEGNKNSNENASPQTWKYERIPEFTEASYKHICFKGSKGICVIYLKQGGPLQESEIQLLENLKNHYKSNLSDRGTEFRWMWLDIQKNSAFEELFGEHEYPSLVVLNPFKKKRFFSLPSDVAATSESIMSILDKVLGGDARFKNFSELPLFATTTKTPKDEL